MNTRIAAAAAFIALISGGPVRGGVDAEQWQTGTFIAVEMSGHGPNPSGKTALARSWDVWWDYCLSAGNQSYSAVGRVSPTRLGLKIHGPIKFIVERDRIIILSSQGKRYTLRLANRNGCR